MVLKPPFLLRKRYFCTQNIQRNHQRWNIKQITKSNFNDSLEQIKNHISISDFIAVSLRNTGSFSSPWHRVSAFDTVDTAYLKSKFAAERYQILQFAVCPFKIVATKVIAHPYNFHLFPRDELKLGMPSYSFTCQTSYLASMAKEGFDFNACIYDGISYLSRAQESTAKVRIGNPVVSDLVIKSSSPRARTVADSVFVERIKSRVKFWRDACRDTSSKKDEALVKSLRKIVLGSEQYGSRPCMTIDVCSENQVQLVLEMLEEFSDDVVPLIIPAKSGGAQAVRAVLMSSKADRDTFKNELENTEAEQNKRVRGFREVIDLISASRKPVVSHNSLNDFAFIYSKFLAPLPSSVDEFMSSLRLAFPQVLDVNHILRKDIGPLRKMSNTSATLSYLKNRVFAPIDMEVPYQATANEGKMHGHNVVKICHLFGKLCSLQKFARNQSVNSPSPSAFREYTNIFNLYPTSAEEPIDEDIRVWTNNTRKVSSKDVVFLWGFREKTSATMLKNQLQGSHKVFNTESFNVRMVDKSCAAVVFWQPGLSETFLGVMNSEEILGPLREMVSDGLKAAGYETYRRVCRSGFWESGLADSLDNAEAEADRVSEGDSETKPTEIYWYNDMIINFDEL